MKNDWELTQAEFDRLLAWLDPDREKAGEKFCQLCERITKFIVSRGCAEAEWVFYEAARRIAQKPPEFFASYQGEPARYFFRVAQLVHLEWLAQHPEQVELPLDLFAPPQSNKEVVQECLEHCLQQLAARDSELLMRYHGDEFPSRIEARKRLAHDFKLSDNALKLRVFRLKNTVSECLRKCLTEKII